MSPFDPNDSVIGHESGGGHSPTPVPPPEDPDVALGVPIGIGVLVVLCVLASFIVSATLLFPRREQGEPVTHAPPSPLAFLKNPTPAPHLQSNPAEDLRQLREREQQRLDSYGWIDRKTNTVHIPIQRAMELIAEHGFPAELGEKMSPDSIPAKEAPTGHPDKSVPAPSEETSSPAKQPDLPDVTRPKSTKQE